MILDDLMFAMTLSGIGGTLAYCYVQLRDWRLATAKTRRREAVQVSAHIDRSRGALQAGATLPSADVLPFVATVYVLPGSDANVVPNAQQHAAPCRDSAERRRTACSGR